ncbi:MAG: VanZ family protein [Bacillota bacterium]|nr:VanZ family protein [Bacillota bacterium]
MKFVNWLKKGPRSWVSLFVWAAFLALAIVIIAYSCVPNAKSAEQTNQVAGTISGIINETTSSETINSDNWQEFYQLIRKGIGHFALFLVTAIFGYLSCVFAFKRFRFDWALFVLISGAAGFLLAGLSEAIQLIPALNRVGQWSDVGIDMTGYAIGTLLPLIGFLIYKIWKRYHPKDQKEIS